MQRHLDDIEAHATTGAEIDIASLGDVGRPRFPAPVGPVGRP